MNRAVPAVITAVIAVIFASDDQRIIAVILVAAFLACIFLKMTDERRILFTAAAGFPLILTAGNPAAAGLLILFLIITMLLCTWSALGPKNIAAALLAGAAGAVFSLQLSVVLPFIVSGIFVVIVVYIIFVREYRLKKEVEESSK